MMSTRLVFAALAFSSAAFAQTPGMGETRPTPPSLDEQRGPVGAGTGKEPAPITSPEKRHSADRALSDCEKLSDGQRDQCLRDERNAATGGSRRTEPATSTPPQNPR
jgi:hypothetical protein